VEIPIIFPKTKCHHRLQKLLREIPALVKILALVKTLVLGKQLKIPGQRLAIARGIVGDRPILILDESTAGLDPVSESHVLERLLESRKGKTTILITYRPSVIERSDWIVLLDQDRVKITSDFPLV